MKNVRTRIAGALVGMVLCGCEDPPDVLPVAPPGAYIPKESPDADAAQALGEAAPSVNRSTPAQSAQAAMKPALPTARGETKSTEGGVKYETLKEGTGAELKPGQKAVMNYVGKLESGEIFDTTRSSQPATPREFTIGNGTLIKGWDEAIPGMKVGEVRKLTIPPEMGYGAAGKPPKIPPSSTLIFEVELVGVK